MKLNLYILKEDLPQDHLHSHLQSEPYLLNIEHPVLCTKLPDTPRENVLYVLHSKLLNHFPNITDEWADFKFLCIGTPPANWLQSHCDFLYYNSEQNIDFLINQLFALFYEYNNWEFAMQHIVDNHLPLKELAVISDKFISNCIYLQGSAYLTIFIYKPKVEKESAFYQEYKKSNSESDNSVMSAEDINELISDSEYNRAIEATEPTIYNGTTFGYRSLYYNLKIDGVFVARLLIDEVLKPITGKDFALIKILGKYIKKGLSNQKIYHFTRSAEWDYLLLNLLKHRLLPENKILSTLNMYHWNINDYYLCLVLKLKTQEDTTTALEPLALNIAQHLKNDCYTIYNNRIVFVCNLSKLKKNDDELLAELLPYLRDNLLTACLSVTFQNFKNLYYYYNQAIIAEEIGLKKEATKWYFQFKDYHMDYLIYKCIQKTLPEVLIPEGLKALLEYDRLKGSSYSDLLKIYLENDRNIAQTARIAYLHRNTCIQRIQRIQSILKMDLNNPNNRLLIQMAFKIMNFSI